MRQRSFIALAAVALWAGGCVPKTPPQPPIVTPVAAVSPVTGVWENTVRGESQGKIIFKPNGEVQFQGGLEFYNPGRWDWDAVRKELVLTLPQAPDRKLDIFKMYIGDGVLAFDRAQKKVTYRFDEQTSTLNIAGWIFSKVDTSKVSIPAEPTLR